MSEEQKMVITVSDLMDMMGFGYVYAIGGVLDCLAMAGAGKEPVVWLTHALTIVDKLKTYSVIPSFAMPFPKLEFAASHALPPAYVKAVSAIWKRPGQPQVLREMIEKLLQEAAKS